MWSWALGYNILLFVNTGYHIGKAPIIGDVTSLFNDLLNVSFKIKTVTFATSFNSVILIQYTLKFQRKVNIPVDIFH